MAIKKKTGRRAATKQATKKKVTKKKATKKKAVKKKAVAPKAKTKTARTKKKRDWTKLLPDGRPGADDVYSWNPPAIGSQLAKLKHAPEDLRDFLACHDGVWLGDEDHGDFLIWDVGGIRGQGSAGDREGGDADRLLFINEIDGNGDAYGIIIRPKKGEKRGQIAHWDHETNEATPTAALGIADFLERWGRDDLLLPEPERPTATELQKFDIELLGGLTEFDDFVTYGYCTRCQAVAGEDETRCARCGSEPLPSVRRLDGDPADAFRWLYFYEGEELVAPPALPFLRYVGVLGGAVPDLARLVGSEGLERVDVRGAEGPPEALAPLARIGARTVHVANMPITDLGFLEGGSALEEVEVWQCEKLRDVSALGACPNLRKVDLRGCRAVDDISILANLEKLEVVILKDTNAKDIAALRELPRLRSLCYARGTSQKTVKALANARRGLKTSNDTWSID